MKASLKTFAAFTLLLISHSGNSQDIHFSQFTLNPMSFNPGLSGVVNADFRATVSYRNQWSGVAPFTTYAASADGKVKFKNTDGQLTLGGMIYKDVAGDLELGTFDMRAHIGYVLPLNYYSDLTFGMSGGFMQRSINPAAMVWDAQYVNGEYNAANPSYETAFYDPVSSPDLGAGLAYSYNRNSSTLSANDHLDVVIGAGVMHLNRPALSSNDDEDRTPMKISVNTDVNIGITNTNFSVRPGFLYSRQGPFQETVLGTYWSVLMREGSKRTGFISVARVSLGTHLRVGDAFIPSLFLELSSYKLGISYDTNYSSLKPATAGKGGIEFTFVYTNPATFYYKRHRRGKASL